MAEIIEHLFSLQPDSLPENRDLNQLSVPPNEQPNHREGVCKSSEIKNIVKKIQDKQTSESSKTPEEEEEEERA